VPLMHQNFSLAPAGRLPEGINRIPFSFPLEPATSSSSSSRLFETFHGSNVQIIYTLSAEAIRPVLRGGSLTTGLCEFLVESRVDPDGAHSVAGAGPVNFCITNEGQDLGPNAGALLTDGGAVQVDPGFSQLTLRLLSTLETNIC